MFVAWRDLRLARGRFALIASVVALITLLVGFLTGLTGGLAEQNVSAVLALPGDRIVLQRPDSGTATFGESTIDAHTEEEWRAAPGVTDVASVSIGRGKADAHEATASVAVLGIAQADADSPWGELAPPHAHQIGLSEGAASALAAGVGDDVTLLGRTYTVASVGSDLWYSHSPVVVLTPDAWVEFDKQSGGDGLASALAVSGSPEWNATAAMTGTVAKSRLSSLTALDTFKSEVGSLALMIAMLFAISAVVVGAFFTVWTMQRSGDVAVLKALGAETSSLVRDALGQALVVLLVGIGVGTAAVAGLGTLAGTALPFVLSPLTTAVPAAALALLGLLGAAVSLRIVTASDPLTALGSNR